MCEDGKRFWERGRVDCMVMENVEFVEACFCNYGYQSAVGGVKEGFDRVDWVVCYFVGSSGYCV